MKLSIKKGTLRNIFEKATSPTGVVVTVAIVAIVATAVVGATFLATNNLGSAFEGIKSVFLSENAPKLIKSFADACGNSTTSSYTTTQVPLWNETGTEIGTAVTSVLNN